MSPILPFLVAGGAFLTVALLFATVWVLRPAEEAATAPKSGLRDTGDEQPNWLARLAAPSDEASRSLIRRQLYQAGWAGPRSLAEYLFVRAALGIALPLLGWMLLRPENQLATLSILLGLAAFGYYAPALFVAARRDSRRRELSKAFPNAPDMLVSVLEAGLGIDSALRHVARDLGVAAPGLAAELDITNAELKAGVPRMEALEHLHERTGLTEVGSLVNVLSQAERFGAGIAPSIRAHAHLSRRRRALAAEKRAAEAAPKLTVAMILFVLPPLFVVLLGPTVVHVVYRLIPTLTGQVPS